MYSVDERDEVVALTGLPAPNIGAPLPRLVASEHEARITYCIRGGGHTVATLMFSGLVSLHFGWPNDEAFDGHPLASRGLRPYGAFEIRESSWIRSLERMNRVHPAHQREAFDRLRHFVLAFHDTTFECVAEAVAETEAR